MQIFSAKENTLSNKFTYINTQVHSHCLNVYETMLHLPRVRVANEILNDSSSLFVFFFYSDDPTTYRHIFTASDNNNVKFILPQAYFDYNVYDEYVSMSRTKTYRFSYRA